ncbi:hypothetical protein E0H39_28825 [Rhizobium leguminosarum bv. viciae]|nr:hypothetical protein [Rhizobium leguminosarum bv. viciae]RWX26306.1 hypothetical protein EHH54_34980 [Rhizobium leguminosarum]NKK16091.1 hypothetical protein [Rhizobium leguminosarum bv. viciae]NKK30293.1 hypothetical protein [Rhizobium leguminosarum bv. viciae]NKK36483.1 hypothetical protein [Rhizobium leguminosarum bv. viciae]
MPQRTKLCCSKPNSVKEMFWRRPPRHGQAVLRKTGGSVRWCYPGACHIGIRSLLETGALGEPLFSRGNADFCLGKTLGFQEN